MEVPKSRHLFREVQSKVVFPGREVDFGRCVNPKFGRLPMDAVDIPVDFRIKEGKVRQLETPPIYPLSTKKSTSTVRGPLLQPWSWNP